MKTNIVDFSTMTVDHLSPVLLAITGPVGGVVSYCVGFYNHHDINSRGRMST